MFVFVRIVPFNHAKSGDILQQFHDNDTDAVTITNHLMWKYFNLVNSPRRRLGLTSDRILMYSPVFFFPKRSILKPVFDEQITRLRETGITRYWIKKYLDDRGMKPMKRAPQQLKILNVLAAFEICLLMYFISSIVLILELLSVRCRRIKRFIDFLTY